MLPFPVDKAHGDTLRNAMNCRVAILSIALVAASLRVALADGTINLTPPSANVPSSPRAAANSSRAEDDLFARWAAVAARARATQPAWSSPLVTTTGMLEQRLRFDVSEQRAGNGARTMVVDSGRGLDLIVSETNEIQIAAPPYDMRTSVGAKPAVSGIGDWSFMRVKQRLAASPASDGNYVLTAWLQLQAPVGVPALTSHSWTYLPTFAFGKGWGNFDVQGTIGAVLPTAYADTLGHQVQTNIALQEHVAELFWPQLEVNWTHYVNGQRGGLNQVYLTPGLVIGRFALNDTLKATFGFGYQRAVAPAYRASPLTPAYDEAWLFTSRLNF